MNNGKWMTNDYRYALKNVIRSVTVGNEDERNQTNKE